MEQHIDALGGIDSESVPAYLLQAAKEEWATALSLGHVHGFRNAQVSLLAPTGTISFLMDCDTTGIEPDIALVKTKKLSGGGTLRIVNQAVPLALEHLGYSEYEVEQIQAHILEHNSVTDAPYMVEDHKRVFDCALGENAIHYMGHVKMMAACQPFLCGAISKTVNLPQSATVEDIESLILEGWRLGLKCLAVYRDGCKTDQPMNAEKKTSVTATTAPVTTPAALPRRKLRKRRRGITTSFNLADLEGYLRTGEYPDGTLGEIFLDIAKEGSTLAGLLNTFSISVSLGLQHGVPLAAYVDKFTGQAFAPAGATDDDDIRFASSLVDYLFRRLAVDYLPEDVRRELNVLTTDERVAELDGAESAKTPTQAASDAPICVTCGVRMQRAGSCFACVSCGKTSGCS